MKYLLILGLVLLFSIGFFIGSHIEELRIAISVTSSIDEIKTEEVNRVDIISLPMNITSTAFENNEAIPSQYTCDGENITPPLAFSEIPEDTESLALIVEDADIPDSVKTDLGIEVFDHWIVFGIPATTKKIGGGIVLDGVAGLNTRGKNEYIGPCPPSGKHHYTFRLYALDINLNLPQQTDKAALEEAMAGHVIDKAELTGVYERQE